MIKVIIYNKFILIYIILIDPLFFLYYNVHSYTFIRRKFYENKKTKSIKNKVHSDCLKVRNSVFIKEQNVDLKTDLQDEEKCQFIAIYKGQECIATGRIYKTSNSTVYFQRIAIKKHFRGKGIGNILIIYMEKIAKKQKIKTILVPAKLTALNFYKKLGYTEEGDIFLRPNRKHLMTRKTLL